MTKCDALKNSLFSIAGAPSQSWAPGSGQYQQGFPQTAHTYPYTMYGYRYPHYDNRWVTILIKEN